MTGTGTGTSGDDRGMGKEPARLPVQGKVSGVDARNEVEGPVEAGAAMPESVVAPVRRQDLVHDGDRQALAIGAGVRLLIGCEVQKQTIPDSAVRDLGAGHADGKWDVGVPEYLEFLAGQCTNGANFPSDGSQHLSTVRRWQEIGDFAYEAQVEVKGKRVNLLILKGDGNSPEQMDSLRQYTRGLGLNTSTDVWGIVGSKGGSQKLHPERATAMAGEVPEWATELDVSVASVRSPHDFKRKLRLDKPQAEGEAGSSKPEVKSMLPRDVPLTARLVKIFEGTAGMMADTLLRNANTEQPWRSDPNQKMSDPTSVFEHAFSPVWPDVSRASMERALEASRTMGGLELVLMGCPHYDRYDVDMAARLMGDKVELAVESVSRAFHDAQEKGAGIKTVTVVNPGPQVLESPIMRKNLHPRLWAEIPDTPENAHLRDPAITRRRDFGERQDAEVRTVMQHSYDIMNERFVEPLRARLAELGMDVEVRVQDYPEFMGPEVVREAEEHAALSSEAKDIQEAVFNVRRQKYEFYAAQPYEEGLARTMGNAAIYYGMAQAVLSRQNAVMVDIEVDPQYWRDLRQAVEAFTGGELPGNYLLPGNAREPWGCERWG